MSWYLWIYGGPRSRTLYRCERYRRADGWWHRAEDRGGILFDMADEACWMLARLQSTNVPTLQFLPDLPTEEEASMKDLNSTHLYPLTVALNLIWPTLQETGLAKDRAAPILEIGGGGYSTPVISALARAMSRPVLTIESLASWADILAKRLQLRPAALSHWSDYMDGGVLGEPIHDICIADVSDTIAWLREDAARWDRGFALAFVDCVNGPRALSRGHLVWHLRHLARLVVAHDTEASCYEYDWDSFAYAVEWVSDSPCTVLATNDPELGERLLSLPIFGWRVVRAPEGRTSKLATAEAAAEEPDAEEV